MTKQTIAERIASALNNGSTGSASIAELIRETEAAIEAASDTAEQERARGLADFRRVEEEHDALGQEFADVYRR